MIGFCSSSTGYGGFFTNASTGFALATTGTTYFNGNVGIGTTNPSYALDVSSASTTQGTMVVRGTNSAGYPAVDMVDNTGTKQFTVGWNNNSGSQGGYVATINGYSLNFITSNTPRMTITGAGSVGIGTTSPSGDLQITDSTTYPIVNVGPSTGTSGNAALYLNGKSSGTATAAKIVADYNSNLSFEPAAGGTTTLETGSGATAIYVNSTGNVGIGTANPGTTLDVMANVINDSMHVTNLNASGWSNVSFFDNNGTHQFEIGYANASASFNPGMSYIFSPAGTNFVVSNASTSLMEINTTSGNVGIGTTSPSSSLTVTNSGGPQIAIGPATSGSGNATLLLQGANSGTVTSATIATDYNSDLIIAPHGTTQFLNGSGANAVFINSTGKVGIGTTSPSTPLHVYTSTSAAIVATFQNGTGTCTFKPTTTTWSCTSDARMKKDIVDTSTDALAWAGDMRIRDFTMKADNSRMTGVIAQEIQKTHPDMVHTLDDGYYTVDAPNPWKMIRAIQELKAKDDELKADNDKLRAEFEAYKASHP